MTQAEQIKERLDIVEVIQGYIRLNKAGVNYKALCPFHNEKTPSFTVSPEKQIWYCFGCNLGGDIFSFIQQIEGIEFKDALRILAERAGVRLVRQNPSLLSEKARLEKALGEANLYFQNQLLNSSEGKMALDYLVKERGLSRESIDKFAIGYAPNQWHSLADYLLGQGIKKQDIVNAGLSYEKSEHQGQLIDRFRGRIMFLIANQQGRAAGFSGRIFPPAYKGKDISSVGKYINSPQTMLFNKSYLLYGLDKAKTAIRRKNVCVVVEGQMDVIASHQAGVENAVASSGTALTPEHLQTIRRLTNNLILAFDIDSAGIAAAQRSIDLALKMGYNIKVINNLGGKDAADAVKTDPENWKRAVLNAIGIVDFYFDLAFKDFNPESAESKKNAAAKVLPVIAKLSNGIERSHYITRLAGRLGVNEGILENAISKTKIMPQNFRGELNEKNQQKNKIKTRRDMLEDQVLSVLVSGKFNDFNFFREKKLSSGIFKNSERKKIAGVALNLLEKKGCVNYAELKNLIKDENVRRVLNYLLILAEDNSNIDAVSDIEKGIAELRGIAIRETLRSISEDIKRAEAKKDKEALKVLVEEFQKFSKKLK